MILVIWKVREVHRMIKKYFAAAPIDLANDFKWVLKIEVAQRVKLY